MKGPIRLQGCETLSFHWMKETVQIEAISVRSNFHVNSSAQFTFRTWMRPSFKGSVNMDLYEDVDEDDYSLSPGFWQSFISIEVCRDCIPALASSCKKQLTGFFVCLLFFFLSKTYQLILKDVIKLNRNLR